MEETVLIGGLGGGGDSGGALPIALELNKLGIRTIFAGFVNAKQRDIRGAERITEALLRVTPDSSTRRVRFFDPIISSMGYETYCICSREHRKAAVEALEWLIKTYKVKALIYVDLGGDSLVFGDEPRMGSWRADTRALSVLAEIGRKGLAKTYLAVGVLGGEGGGSISQNHLAENVMNLLRDGAYYGYYVPEGEAKEEVIQLISEVLRRVPSGMLKFYLDSLRGLTGLRDYNILYLRGRFYVKEYYKYHFFFDPVKVCGRSWLCQRMTERGFVSKGEIITRSIRRRPPIRMEDAVKELLKKRINFNEII